MLFSFFFYLRSRGEYWPVCNFYVFPLFYARSGNGKINSGEVYYAKNTIAF